MTALEILDQLLCVFVEYETPPTLKDLLRLRQTLGGEPYRHISQVVMPVDEEVE